MRNLNRFLNLTLVLAFGMLIMVHFASAQAVTTIVPTTRISTTQVCPTGSGVTYDQYEKCIISSNGLDKISGNDFFSSLSVDSIISAGTTILLAIIVIVLTIKIVLAAFQWVNNDAQDKNKKEAIKSITNGVIGLVISFSAYFVVIIIRAFFSVDGQLVNCSNLYFASSSNLTLTTGDYSGTTSEFQNCMKTSGKADVVSQNFIKFRNEFYKKPCSDYYQLVPNSKLGFDVSANDRSKLNQCFVDVIKSLQ